MASQVGASRHLFRYQNFHIDKRQPLGHGAYGAVYKAKCDQLPCAAKVIHQTILDPTDPGSERVMQRFQLECSVLERIRHPNIVQYLGLCRDPESRLPALLMELLDESLTKMLERSQRPLAYFAEVNICHDIALAVAYLHSNDIIHRDLSSNNVLIMAKSRAKVTDFGMSKLAGAAPTMTHLTMCPGTQAYMAPEALEEPPRYTKKLDCFSEGVMMIQVCTRLWPEPGPRSKTVQDLRSPTGMIKMPVLEPERRKNHIDMIDRSHHLLPIAMDCLRYQERERPSSEELCQRLAGLKENTEYGESVQHVEREQNDIATLERQIGEMQVREATIVQQLRQLQGEIWSKDNQLQQHQQQEGEFRLHIWRLNQQLEEQGQIGEMQIREAATVQQLQEAIQSKDDQIQRCQQLERELRSQNLKLNQQLKEQEQVTAEILQTNHYLQRQVEQLRQQLSQQTQSTTKSTQPPQPVALEGQVRGRQLQQTQVKQSQSSPVQKSHTSTKKLMITEWKDGGKAPIIGMSRGACVVNGDVAYFMNWDGRTCSFNSSTGRWSELPKCPCQDSSLAVIRGLLTAIGGVDQNKLLSIVDDRNKKWVEHFPPMPTKRHLTAAVTTKQHLIVAGGEMGSSRLNAVQVLDIETLVWSMAASLPHPYTQASSTICGDHLYMLGGFDRSGYYTKSVLTCSLTELLRSRGETSTDSVWSKIADAPVVESTCAAVGGDLVAVGGRGASVYLNTSAVYKYNMISESWDLITNMPTARHLCLVAVLPTNEMMVVGGEGGAYFVKIAKITYSA